MATPRPLRILLFGKDGRTDAMAAACSRPDVELHAGSEYMIPGLVEKCSRDRVHILRLDEPTAMVKLALDVEPDLVLIGPEEPLAAGLVDQLKALHIPCFGPSQHLARIETSKSWARELLERNDIPGNPRYRVFDSTNGIEDYLQELGEFVVKPDGLTGGKGVRVSGDHLASVAEGLDYASSICQQEGKVIIEERLDGEEFSLQTITDGENVVHCPIVQDHKRAFDQDTGPNTGGMGSYTLGNHSLPFLEAAEVREAAKVNERVIEALGRSQGQTYRGVLYGGFMATGDGLRLIEFNARFGDPEAMNVLPLLTAEFVDICRSVAHGTLSEIQVGFQPMATVCKYVVPEPYPESSENLGPIHVRATNADGLHTFWAATKELDSQVFLTGSRAVAFVGVAPTLEDAEKLAERGAQSVTGAVRHRSDIVPQPAIDSRVQHMKALRNVSTLDAARVSTS